MKYPYINSSGAIVLSDDVCCDGFAYGVEARVQTHVHVDHMSDFSSSKGTQDIYLTSATRDLLIAEFNSDLPWHINIKPLGIGDRAFVNGSTVKLLDAGHMLGAVQVEVETGDGSRIGYSGDFAWPLEEVVQVERLVLDATYGSPRSYREFTQREAENRLCELVTKGLGRGSVVIRAHRGTLHRALARVTELTSQPVVVTETVQREIPIFRRCGYDIPALVVEDSQEGKELLQSKQYIRVVSTRDRYPAERHEDTSIVLSAYHTQSSDPVVEYSPSAFGVAISDHADFVETLEYVDASGAHHVITDNFRGPHAVELALELKRRLGVDASPSELQTSRAWGA